MFNVRRPSALALGSPFALALALALLVATPVASAHASLSSADPPPNGHVDANATLVTVRFTEDVERSYTSVDVFDIGRASFATGAVVFDDAHRDTIRRSLRPLPDGVYSVEWQALSTDSHTTKGSFLISVGSAHLAYVPAVEAHEHGDATGVIVREGSARFAYYFGAFVAVGVPFFHLVVDRRAPAPRRAALAGMAGAVVALVAAYAGLQLLAERTALDFVETATTRAGMSFDWRGTLAAASALVFAFGVILTRPRRLLLAVGGSLALSSLAAAALGSHAAADPDLRALSTAIDMLHLAMGALWIGGVVALVMAARGRSADEVGALIERFTPLAIASVIVVLATGTYASLRRIPAWSDLWATTYGELVSAKILLLVALIGFGAFHKQIMGPRLRAGTARPQTFRRALIAEALVMALVLVAAGALASSSPPDEAVQTGHQGALGFATFNAESATTHVVLAVAPAPVVVGIQNLTIQLHPLTSTSVASGALVTVKIAPPGGKEPDVFYEPGPTRVASDTWVMQGGFFTSVGDWNVWVLVQRPEVGEFSKERFTVPVGAPAP